jgi:hypothetical protein
MIFPARLMMERTLNDNYTQALQHKILLQNLESIQDHPKMETRVIKVRILIMHEHILELRGIREREG